MQYRFIQQASFYLLLFISFVVYVLLGYFTPRTSFYQLGAFFVILFIIYGIIVRYAESPHQLTISIGASLLARLLMFFMIPNLSDDYFRFIWDGRLLACGFNPYAILPSFFINTQEAVNAGLDKELFTGLNSPDYYTVYPPVSQFVFAVAAKISPYDIPGSVMVMRSFIILAEAGTLFIMIKLLEHFRLPKKSMLLYAWNPLIIIELSGNLHFEAIMIFWLLLSLYLLVNSRFTWSAVCFALAVGTKLIPLIFLPFLIRRLPLRTILLYYSVVGVTTAILFIPFLNQQLFSHIFSSIELYVRQFEFNSGIFHFIWWAKYKVTGCNSIAYTGIALSIITLFSLIFLAYVENSTNWTSLLRIMLLATVIYYFLATTVHPWYLATAVMLSVFTPYRFVIIWSALIPMSYIHYQTFPGREYREIVIITLEYLAVTSFAVYEYLIDRRTGLGLQNNSGR